jgi:hypothetical protein
MTQATISIDPDIERTTRGRLHRLRMGEMSSNVIAFMRLRGNN